MRWRYCYYCGAEQESVREDDTFVIIYECHNCWEDYCDRCGSKNVRICNACLNKKPIIGGNKYVATRQDKRV